MFWKKKDAKPALRRDITKPTERRTGEDRREAIRYEPDKDDRRKNPRDPFR